MHSRLALIRTTNPTRQRPYGPDLDTPHLCRPAPLGYFNFTNTIQQFFHCCSCDFYTRLQRQVRLYWTVSIACGKCGHSPCPADRILCLELHRSCWACGSVSKAAQTTCGRCRYDLEDPACLFEWIMVPYPIGFQIRRSADMVREEVVVVRLAALHHGQN